MTDQRFEDLIAQMNRRFDQADARMDRLEARMDDLQRQMLNFAIVQFAALLTILVTVIVRT